MIDTDRYSKVEIKCFAKLFTLMDFLAELPEGTSLPLHEISARVKDYAPSVHRTLNDLCIAGFALKVSRGVYACGPRLTKPSPAKNISISETPPVEATSSVPSQVVDEPYSVEVSLRPQAIIERILEAKAKVKELGVRPFKVAYISGGSWKAQRSYENFQSALPGVTWLNVKVRPDEKVYDLRGTSLVAAIVQGNPTLDVLPLKCALSGSQDLKLGIFHIPLDC